MSRFSWLFVALVCCTFLGCGEDTMPAPDEAEVKATTPIEDDMKDSGMGEMTDAEYLSGGKQQ